MGMLWVRQWASPDTLSYAGRAQHAAGIKIIDHGDGPEREVRKHGYMTGAGELGHLALVEMCQYQIEVSALQGAEVTGTLSASMPAGATSPRAAG